MAPVQEDRFDISRDFVGIVGKLDLTSLESPILHNSHLHPRSPLIVDDCDGHSNCWSAQILRPSAPKSSRALGQNPHIITTFAGSIWQLPARNGLSEVNALRNTLSYAASEQNFQMVRQIEGDFVAAVLRSGKVVLLRSLTSTTTLYFRVTPKAVLWSTNFMDLVDDPISDLDFGKLAYVAWGGNRIPYSGIETVSQDEVVTLSAGKISRMQFDDYITPVHNKRHMPLPEWGEMARELLLAAVAKRAKRFKTIGLLLSGGIDSGAIARCLVDAGAQVQCYHWASPSYPPADESPYVRKVSTMLDIPVTTIDIGSDRLSSSSFLSAEWRFAVPYNHSLYRWWKETISLAQGEIDCLMSGRFGGSFHLGVGIRPPTSIGLSEAAKYIWNSLSLPVPTKQLLIHLIPALAKTGFFQKFLPAYDPEEPLLNLNREEAVTIEDTAAVDGRQVHHFTDQAKRAVIIPLGQGFEDSLQTLALNINDLHPADLVHTSPYLDRDLRSFVRSIPNAYRCYPYGGQVIDKPVLRQAFMDLLPAEVIRHNFTQFYAGIRYQYCLNNRRFLKEFFAPDSYLVQYDVIDSDRFSQVLSDQRKLQECSGTIFINFMAELWLRTLASKKEGKSC